MSADVRSEMARWCDSTNGKSVSREEVIYILDVAKRTVHFNNSLAISSHDCDFAPVGSGLEVRL